MISTGFSFWGGLLVIGSCLLHSQADNGGQSSCVTGSNGCGRCLANGNCVYCKVGFKLDTSTFTCTPKPTDGCDVRCASGCTSAGFCDAQCDPGFVLVSKNCKSCDANCDPSSGCTEAGKCSSTCIVGFTLRDNICKACASNCKSGCDKAGPFKCDSECDQGYALSDDGKCRACDENCHQSSGCKKPFTCDSKCNDGYTLSTDANGATTCQPCHEDCAGTCDKAGAFRCDKDDCKPGHARNSKTKLCGPCGLGCDIKIGCKKAGPNLCDGCMTGYYLDPNLHACYPCDSNCDPAAGCSKAGANRCDGPCKPGYELGQDSKCSESTFSVEAAAAVQTL